jgi:hypothetical protein
LAGTAINSFMMITYYRAELFPGCSSIPEAFALMASGRKTTEMMSLERDFHAKKTEEAAGSVGQINAGWSIWSKIQVFVIIILLSGFALGLDVSIVCISCGILLMTTNAWKRRDFDLKSASDDIKKHYDVDGSVLPAEEEELVTESELGLTDVDYGLIILFIGQVSFTFFSSFLMFFLVCLISCLS